MIFKNVPVKVVENNLLIFDRNYSLYLFTDSPISRDYKSLIVDLGDFKLSLGKHTLRHLEIYVFGSVCLELRGFVVSLYK